MAGSTFSLAGNSVIQVKESAKVKCLTPKLVFLKKPVSLRSFNFCFFFCYFLFLFLFLLSVFSAPKTLQGKIKRNCFLF